jgi:hypothetical protein
VDLHKRIANDVRSKKQRDAAQEFLRKLYAKAIEGTDWEQLQDELDAKSEPIDHEDPLELYEVEDRGVGVIWPDEGMGHAWAWSKGWRYAPGLVNKSWLEGTRLSRGAFARDFAEADLAALEVLAAEALKRPPDQTR